MTNDEYRALDIALMKLFLDVDCRRTMSMEDGIKFIKFQVFDAYALGYERGLQKQKAGNKLTSQYY